MRWSEKLSRYIEGKKKQIQRGVEVSEQMHAERQRKKMDKAKSYKPGMIRYGLAYKQKPLDFMHDLYEKRKNDRENKK